MKKRVLITIGVDIEITEVVTACTSLQGYLTTTYAKLCKVFGPPNSTGPSLDNKIDVEWEGLIDDQVFTIYNYKDGPAYLGENGMPVVKITDWHIGAHKESTAKKLIEAFYAEVEK